MPVERRLAYWIYPMAILALILAAYMVSFHVAAAMSGPTCVGIERIAQCAMP